MDRKKGHQVDTESAKNTKKAKPAVKAKNMMYVQQQKHLPSGTLDNLVQLIEKKLEPKKYAVIVHDKDTDRQGQPEEEHIHVMLSFENARSVKNIAKLLGDKMQYIEAWQGDARNGYAYLTHSTDKSRMKHQYDASEVRANFDYQSFIEKGAKEIAKTAKYSDASMAKVMLDLLYVGEITKDEVEKKLSGSQYGKIHRQIEEVNAKRLKNLAEEWRKEMAAKGGQVKVIWIYGVAGTGKSSLAKEYARKKGQDYYISGSSRDIFQNYGGQHTLILDELRPKDIPYHDLLRITDPFSVDSEVMAPSRFTDKALACDLIIVTTPYDPFTFYKEIFPTSIDGIVTDSFFQLYRRISLTICMESKEIWAAAFDGFVGYYYPKENTNRPNPYSAENRPPAAENAMDIYNNMFD